MKNAWLGAVCALVLVSASAGAQDAPPPPAWSLAIHGGAGTLDRAKMTPEKRAEYEAALQEALDAGRGVLAQGGSAMDAVKAAILPMDGFHFDDAVLHAAGRRPWKGAPDTFDVGGLASVLARLRANTEEVVAVPVFDRDLEISRGSARLITRDRRLIIVEGNYLLLDQAPWSGLAAQFDLTVMIDVPEPVLQARLRNRWAHYDLSEDQILQKLEDNDLPNGRTVQKHSRPADLILRQTA
jgi:pantothenate kinase